MSMNVDSFISKCNYTINLKDAALVIYNASTGSLRARQATDFNKTLPSIKKLIEESVQVHDPKKDPADSDKSWQIIFYGEKSLAKNLIAQEKGKQASLSLNNSDQERTPYSQDSSRFLSSVGPARPSRVNTNNTSSLHNQSELISLLNAIRDEQLQNRKLLQDLTRENMEMREKIDDLSKKKYQGKKKVGYSEGAELIQFCTCEIAKIRTEKNFNERLEKIDWVLVNIAAKERDNVLIELRFERKVSRMVSNIAKIIFGPLLLTHILGRYGKRERSAREQERSLTFSLEQEERLRECLRVFGDLFLTDKIWKSIVQYHVNQKGRDVKKQRKNARVTEESETETDEESSRNKRLKSTTENQDDPIDKEKNRASDSQDSENLTPADTLLNDVFDE